MRSRQIAGRPEPPRQKSADAALSADGLVVIASRSVRTRLLGQGDHPEAQSTLAELGHIDLAEIAFRIGDANSAMRVGERLIGVADPRNPGGAAGF